MPFFFNYNLALDWDLTLLYAHIDLQILRCAAVRQIVIHSDFWECLLPMIVLMLTSIASIGFHPFLLLRLLLLLLLFGSGRFSIFCFRWLDTCTLSSLHQLFLFFTAQFDNFRLLFFSLFCCQPFFFFFRLGLNFCILFRDSILNFLVLFKVFSMLHHGSIYFLESFGLLSEEIWLSCE